jgi:hypothetical protein
MLWNVYPECLDHSTLKSAQASLKGDLASAIPRIVWLLENPKSPIALPGAIDLYGHDCMHLLLKQGFSSAHEAYVVGFTMGNSRQLRPIHLWILRFAARYLYPSPYRMSAEEIEIFNVGVKMGRSAPIRDLCDLDFHSFNDIPIAQLRQQLGLKMIWPKELSLTTNNVI